MKNLFALIVSGAALFAAQANAQIFFFSTGSPDGLMALGSRQESPGNIEIEAADDFVTTLPTEITSATFTGLLPLGVPLTSVQDVTIEIYRVFPNDSNVGRTSGPPTFSTPNSPTRVNSPSDNAFATRDSVAGQLTFTPGIVNPNFTASNSILNGIALHAGGEGAVTGQEVTFNVLFNTPFTLPPDHYFFVPQVQLANGNFFWLSAPKPIVPPGTPFPAGFTDLQAWIRNGNIDPDWLRAGTDIVDGATPPTFNATFSVAGIVVPEPGTISLLFAGLALVGGRLIARKGSTRISRVGFGVSPKQS